MGLLLDTPEITRLITELDATRWTGRPGYPTRALVGVALAKSVYGFPTWSRTVALVHEHTGLQRALGAVPSVYACYRFTRKLHEHETLLDACVSRVLQRLRLERPGMGENLAIDASDLPAYASGQRYVSRGGRERAPGEYSDADASWGHRSSISTRKGGGFYGYKLHAAVCTLTGLPVAWELHTARTSEYEVAMPLLDTSIRHGMPVQTVAMDKGYDGAPCYEGCLLRGTLPVIPLRAGNVKTRVRLSRFLPRDTHRWKTLYRGRVAVEREFGRLKHEWRYSRCACAVFRRCGCMSR